MVIAASVLANLAMFSCIDLTLSESASSSIAAGRSFS